MLDNLRVDQFPMGLFNTQAARLMDWTGSGTDAEWRKLLAEIENKATPAWVNRRFAGYDEELMAERKKREAAQARGDAAHGQLDKWIASHDDLRRGRELAVAEADKARAELSGLKEALEAAKSQNDDLSGRLAAVERMGATHRGGVPLWAMVLGLMGALGLGAGGTYFMQSSPMRTALEGELSRTNAKLETAQKELAVFKQQEAQTRQKAEAEVEQARQREVDKQKAVEQAEIESKLKAAADPETRAATERKEYYDRIIIENRSLQRQEEDRRAFQQKVNELDIERRRVQGAEELRRIQGY